MYLVYILRRESFYIGMTNDFFKRWQQHNRILNGGAKYKSCRYSNFLDTTLYSGWFSNKIKQCNVNGNLNVVKDIYVV